MSTRNKSTKSKKNTAKSTVANQQREPQEASKGTTAFHSVLVFFRYNALGKFLLYILCIILILLFNIFVSGNQLEVFGLITGIEILITMITLWTLFLLKKSAVIDRDEIKEEK